MPVYDEIIGKNELMSNVRARFSQGVLRSPEPLDLKEGAEVTVLLDDPPPKGLAAIVERVTELQKNVPPDAWDGLPTDLAKNKKHYLYGHPKDED